MIHDHHRHAKDGDVPGAEEEQAAPFCDQFVDGPPLQDRDHDRDHKGQRGNESPVPPRPLEHHAEDDHDKGADEEHRFGCDGEE